MRLQGIVRCRVSLCAIALTGVFTSSALAAEPIEGTWQFQGGVVTVSPTGPGAFAGVVTAPTKFAACEHPLGQQMWSLRGSEDMYVGTHTWFDPHCGEKPGGAAIWEVTNLDERTMTVRFCTNHPDDGPVTRDRNGASTGRTHCYDMTKPKPTAVASISLPSAKRCVSRRLFEVRIPPSRRRDPVVAATVFVNGKQVATRQLRYARGNRTTAIIDLRGLPAGTVKVKIRARSQSGKTLLGIRRYRTCTAKRPAHKPPKL